MCSYCSKMLRLLLFIYFFTLFTVRISCAVFSAFTLAPLKYLALYIHPQNWLWLFFAGLLHVRQVPHLNCLASNLPDHKDLAFKLKRKQFTIEVLCQGYSPELNFYPQTNHRVWQRRRFLTQQRLRLLMSLPLNFCLLFSY